MIQYFPNSQTFLQIGSLVIRWYALTFLGGALLTYACMNSDMKRNGYPTDTADDVFLGCLLWGLIAARLWYCLFSTPVYYFSHPLKLIAIWEGGIGIQGGILGGLGYGWYYAKKHRLVFLRLTDAVMPNMLIAQAIGRWGNFINQEAYGQTVSAAYFNHLPAFIKNGMYIDGAYRQPTFLWESVLDLLGFVLLRYVFRRYNKTGRRGDLTAMYLFWYGMSRFFVEGYRTDNLIFLGMKMSQLMALLSMAAGLVLYFWLRRQPAEKPAVLFDLDGTLLNTAPAIIGSYRELFRRYRKEEDFDQAKQVEVLGPALEVEMKKFFPEQDPQKMVEEYRVINNELHQTVVQPMPHAAELLKWLHDSGYKVGIVSTKIADTVRMGLRQFDLESYVDTVVGHDEVTTEKPDPEGIRKACQHLKASQDACIYIGDSATDVLAGRNAGVYTVAYPTCEEKRQSLLDAKPNLMISDLAQLEAALEKGGHSWTYTMM